MLIRQLIEMQNIVSIVVQKQQMIDTEGTGEYPILFALQTSIAATGLFQGSISAAPQPVFYICTWNEPRQGPFLLPASSHSLIPLTIAAVTPLFLLTTMPTYYKVGIVLCRRSISFVLRVAVALLLIAYWIAFGVPYTMLVDWARVYNV